MTDDDSQLEIPRRAIDFAQLTEKNIETNSGEMSPQELHVKAGEVLEDQVTEALKSDAPNNEVLLKSDALVIEGIQQAATHVLAEDNSIVEFDAIGGEASVAVTAAVKSLADDDLTEPIAQAAIRILDDAEITRHRDGVDTIQPTD